MASEGPEAAPAKETNRVGGLVTRLVIGLQIVLVLGGWLYRSTIYWRIPVALGEPYGLGDVIELLIYYALLGGSLFALGLALLFVGARRLRRWPAIVALACAALFAVPIFLLVHSHLPRL